MGDRRWETEETGDRRRGQEMGTGDEIHETGRETVDRTVVPETENRRQEMGRLTGDRTGDRRGDTREGRQETGQGRQDRGDRTVVQETVDFVLRWDWETGDRRQEKGDRK